MKTRNSTKSKLLSSVIALVLCVSMLIGATFAWFTDTASTGVNKIQAGNLDIQLLAEDGSSLEGKTLSWQKADGHTGESVLWEPGCTYFTDGFQIKNAGDLNLKFKIAVNGITSGDATLLNAIDFYLTTTKSNDLSSTGAIPLNSFTSGEFKLAPGKFWKGTTDSNDTGSTSTTIYLAGHMKEDAGNEYQGLSIDGIGITVYATQMEAEFDSFNNSYDHDADYIERHATIMNDANGQTITLEAGKTYTVGNGQVVVAANGDISYTNNGAAQTVTIQTDGGNLTVNAPNDTVYHYGTAGLIDIIKVASNSYHEFGDVGVLSITDGRAVIEKGDNVARTQVKSNAAVIAVPQNVVLKTTLAKAGGVTEIRLQKGDEAAVVITSEENWTKPVDQIPAELKEVITGTVEAASDNYVARIGNEFYVSLADAIAAVSLDNSEPTVITMLCDVKNAAGMKVVGGKNFVVDFNGYTYELNKPGAGSTNTETNGFQLLKDSTIVMKNGTITISEGNLTPATNGRNIKRIIQNYSKLTLQDMTIDGTNQYDGADHVMSFNNDPVLITGNTNIIAAEGEVAFDADGNWGGYNRSQVTIDTTGTIVGNIELGQGELKIKNANVKGGVVFCTSCGTDETVGQKDRLTITGGTFTVGSEAALNTLLDSIAADASNVTINLASDIYLEAPIQVSKNVTINGQNHTITSGVFDSFKVTGTVNFALKNLTIESQYRRTVDGVEATTREGSKLSFENVTINNAEKAILFNDCKETAVSIKGCTLSSLYPFNVGRGTITSFTVEDSQLNGWTSFNQLANGGVFQFKNCSFGEKFGYATLKPYGDTTFEGCTISEEFFKGLESGIASGNVTPITVNFNKCFVKASNGTTQALTVDLLKNAFNYDITSGSSSGDSTINSQFWYVDGKQIAFATSAE